MHRCPTHVPLKFALESPLARPMHNGRVIPTNHVPDISPLDTENVLLLRRMRKQRLNQFGTLWFRDPGPVHMLEMMQVVRNVQVHPTRGFVELHDLMPSEWVCLRVHGCQVLGLRARFAPTVPETVGANVVVFDQLGLERVRKLGERGACVCEFRVASVAWRGQFVGPQQ